MLQSTPERADLRCPACRDRSGSAAVRWERVHRTEGDEVIDGVLACARCDTGYPVEDRVAVVLRDLPAFLSGERPDTALDVYRRADEGLAVPDGITAGRHPAEDLAARLPAGARVLDLGCGTGGGARYLGARAGLLLGLDLQRERVAHAIAHRRGVSDFLVADAQDPPVAASDWDGVLMAMVYDVVPSPPTLLAQAGAALRLGGLLVTASPYQFPAEGAFRPTDPAADLRLRLSCGPHGQRFAIEAEDERLWVLADNERRFFVYRLDVLVARRLA